ncbi:MAG: hypothetical protein KBC27_01985, partial [Rickettsiales bacterium]|nr:hypothetical protein [Rickettsiales bacterium]
MKNLHLVLFASLLSIQTPVINYALANPSAIEAQEAEESELAAINFENMTEMRMDDVPTSIRNKAKSEQGNYKDQFSNLTTNFFKTNTGHVIFSITGEKDGQKTHVQSYVWKNNSQKSKETKVVANKAYLDKIVKKLNLPAKAIESKINEESLADKLRKWSPLNSFRQSSTVTPDTTATSEPAVTAQATREPQNTVKSLTENSATQNTQQLSSTAATEDRSSVDNTDSLGDKVRSFLPWNWGDDSQQKEDAKIEKQRRFEKDNIASKNPQQQVTKDKEDARLASIEQQKAKQAQADTKWWKDTQSQSEQEQSRMLADARGKAGEEFAAEGKRQIERDRAEKQRLFEKDNIASKNPQQQVTKDKEDARLSSIEQQKAKQAQNDANWWGDAQSQSAKEAKALEDIANEKAWYNKAQSTAKKDA